MCGAVPGERVVPARSPVGDGADEPVGRAPQPQADRRPAVPPGVRAHLVHREQVVLDGVAGAVHVGELGGDAVPEVDEVGDVPGLETRAGLLQRLVGHGQRPDVFRGRRELRIGRPAVRGHDARVRPQGRLEDRLGQPLRIEHAQAPQGPRGERVVDDGLVALPLQPVPLRGAEVDLADDPDPGSALGGPLVGELPERGDRRRGAGPVDVPAGQHVHQRMAVDGVAQDVGGARSGGHDGRLARGQTLQQEGDGDLDQAVVGVEEQGVVVVAVGVGRSRVAHRRLAHPPSPHDLAPAPVRGVPDPR